MQNKLIFKLIVILAAFTLTGMGASALAGWGGMGFGHHGSMHYGGGHHGSGWHHGGGWGPGYLENLSDDEIKALQKERKTFFEATQDLRQEIYQKRLELRSELAKRAPDAKNAAKLQKEISGLEADFDQKHLDHQIKMRRINPRAGKGYMGGGPMGPAMMGHGGYGCPNDAFSGSYRGPGMGYGMMGPGMGYGMMGPGMGPGMMRGGMGPQGGYAPGYGMMERSRDHMQGSQHMDADPQSYPGRRVLSKNDAGSIVQGYLASTRNPNLKLGKIKDSGNVFEAEIVTKDNSLVDKILVDKTTGWMRPAY